MNGWGVSRGVWPKPLCLGLLLAGLFMMHGVTAASSPLHVSEPVLALPMAHAAPQPAAHAPGGPMMAHGGPANAHGGPMGGGGMDMGGCIAGAICFALLGLAVLGLAALAGRALDPLPALAGAASPALRRRGPPRTRPPSIYRLSVLRL